MLGKAVGALRTNALCTNTNTASALLPLSDISIGVPMPIPNSYPMPIPNSYVTVDAECAPCCRTAVDPTSAAAAVSTHSQLHDCRVTSSAATMQRLWMMQSFVTLMPVHAADD